VRASIGSAVANAHSQLNSDDRSAT